MNEYRFVAKSILCPYSDNIRRGVTNAIWGAEGFVFKREYTGVHIAWQGRLGVGGGWGVEGVWGSKGGEGHMGKLCHNCKAQHSNALIWPDSV